MTNYTIGETLLQINNLTVKYDNVCILRDINLEIKDIIGIQTTGQVVTLLGRSGSGKSTLFRMIAGLENPTVGEVLLYGNPVQPGQVGMVLQKYPLFKHYTLLGNLKLVCKDMAKVNEYLQEFDIFHVKDKYPQQLSGGQQQRAAIVQQLLCSDHFVLLDEPFSGLDPVATEKLCRTINKVVNLDDKNTVIISSHILEPSMAISDTIWMIGHHYTTDILDEKGNPSKIDGATVMRTYDLAAAGMAWNPEIRKDFRFHSLVEEIRDFFPTI